MPIDIPSPRPAQRQVRQGCGAWAGSGRGDGPDATPRRGSPEYAADNPTPPSNAEFGSALYGDALGRAPDPAGGAYWTNQLNSGADTRAQVAVGIAESPEAVQHLAGRIEAGFHIA